jgi:hypothetical protein
VTRFSIAFVLLPLASIVMMPPVPARAEDKCPFGPFCGRSVAAKMISTEVSMPNSKLPTEFAAYFGNNGRVFWFEPGKNYGTVCSLNGETTTFTCNAGVCSNGATLPGIGVNTATSTTLCKISYRRGGVVFSFNSKTETQGKLNDGASFSGTVSSDGTATISTTTGTDCLVSQRASSTIRTTSTISTTLTTNNYEVTGASTSCRMTPGNILQ